MSDVSSVKYIDYHVLSINYYNLYCVYKLEKINKMKCIFSKSLED